MKITLVRHGQTESNYNEICQGSTNILLNDTGRRQCQKLRDKIKDKKYDVCYMSPLVRAVETAMILIGDRVEIVEKDIEDIVTRSIEYQVFELTEALAKKNSVKVYAILGDMKAKRDEYKMLPSLIYSHFRRLFMIAINAHS